MESGTSRCSGEISTSCIHSGGGGATREPPDAHSLQLCQHGSLAHTRECSTRGFGSTCGRSEGAGKRGQPVPWRQMCRLFVFSLPSMGFPGSSAGKESSCNAGDPGLIPGSRRSPGEGIGYPLRYSWASLVAQTVKNPPAAHAIWVRSLGWEDPLEEGMATHSSTCLANPHGQRSLAGCSPWGRKELDTTE